MKKESAQNARLEEFAHLSHINFIDYLPTGDDLFSFSDIAERVLEKENIQRSSRNIVLGSFYVVEAQLAARGQVFEHTGHLQKIADKKTKTEVVPDKKEEKELKNADRKVNEEFVIHRVSIDLRDLTRVSHAESAASSTKAIQKYGKRRK